MLKSLLRFDFLPTSRPQAKSWVVDKAINQRLGFASQEYPVALLGVRGYYKNSMGAAGKNDRKIYDDAIFLRCSDGRVLAFNANVDPGAFKTGIANLNTGIWWYQLGIHGLSKPKILRYEALVQAAKVTVTRDGQGEETGFFGVNIHRGGIAKVSSIACQTIAPLQWPQFISTVRDELGRIGQKKIPYVLMEAGPEGGIS